MERLPEPEFMDLNLEAKAYAEADFAEVNQAFAERLVEFAGSFGRARTLDLGTGPADIPLRVARLRPRWHITAVDASFAMLAIAGSRFCGEQISLLQADAKRLPLSDSAFDVVFANSILHHITDVGPFWSELRRVAKGGATVFLRDLARPATAQEARAIVDRYAGTESDLLQEEFYRSLLAAYTPSEVRDQLQRAGLSTLEVAIVSDRHLDVFGRLV